MQSIDEGRCFDRMVLDTSGEEARPATLRSHLVLDAFDQDDGVIMLVHLGAGGQPHIAEANGTFSRLTGHTEAELRGMPLARLQGPFTDGPTQAAMNDAIRAGSRMRGAIEFGGHGGRPFWLGFTVLPIVDPAMQGQHCIVMGRDITEKRKLDQEQATIQALLAAVFHKVDAAVVIVGETGHVLLPNPMFQTLVGYAAGELSHMTVSELTAPQHRAEAEKAQRHQFETGEPHELTSMAVHKDGRHIPVHLRSVIAPPSGKQRFRIVTLHRTPTAEPPGARGGLAVIGTIEVLGLDAIKAAYGARWGSMRDRLMMMAEGILKRRLSSEDVFTRTPRDGFNIWFKFGTQDENAVRLEKMVREVRVTLLAELGEDTSPTFNAYTDVAELQDPAAPQNTIMATLSRHLVERRRHVEQRAESLLKGVMEEKSFERYEVDDASGRPMRMSFIDLPKDVRVGFATAMSLVGGPAAELDAGLFRLGLAVTRVLEDMQQAPEATYLFTLPLVLFMTRKNRMAILQELRALPPPVRAKLVIMLSDMPPDISSVRATEIGSLLRPIVKGVGIVIDDTEALSFQFTGTPFCVVGLVSESMAAATDARLRSFFVRVHSTKAKVLVRLAANEGARRWQQIGADLTTAY